MKLRTPCVLALLAFGLLPACGKGPSGDPEKSLARYLGCALDKNYRCCGDLIVPDLKATKGKEIVQRLDGEWFNVLTHKYIVMETKVGGDYATIQILESYDVRGIDARDVHSRENQYNSYGLRQIDGLWYVIPRGADKIQAF